MMQTDIHQSRGQNRNQEGATGSTQSVAARAPAKVSVAQQTTLSSRTSDSVSVLCPFLCTECLIQEEASDAPCPPEGRPVADAASESFGGRFSHLPTLRTSRRSWPVDLSVTDWICPCNACAFQMSSERPGCIAHNQLTELGLRNSTNNFSHLHPLRRLSQVHLAKL